MDTFYDGDLKDIWDSDLDPAESLKLTNETEFHNWFLDRDEKYTTVVLNDRLISDALLNATFPIKSEHSYSLISDGGTLSSPKSFSKIEDLENDFYPALSLKSVTSNMRATVDPKFLSLSYSPPEVLPSVSVSEAISQKIKNDNVADRNSDEAKFDKLKINWRNGQSSADHVQHLNFCENSSDGLKSCLCKTEIISDDSSESESRQDGSSVKMELLSPNNSCPSSPSCSNFQTKSCLLNVKLRNITMLSATDPAFQHQNEICERKLSRNRICTEIDLNNIRSGNYKPSLSRLNPLTTAHSNVVFDNEDSQSDPVHDNFSNVTCDAAISSNRKNAIKVDCIESVLKTSIITNVIPQISNMNKNISYNRQPIQTPLISSQPKGSTGNLMLTEEEQRTLLAEGYPIPQKLPLTKAEEKSLKKVRRKIKNKISAQESRRKKKEYMDQLERRVETLSNENSSYKCKVKSLEDAYASVLGQLKRLESIVEKQIIKQN